jgi:AcrR family transcriptional regulator
MNLRKEKAARLKVQILEQTLRHLGKKSFDDLYVLDICEQVKISKVTFFKYFPQKEDLLMYYLRIFCLKRLVDLREHPKEGLAGIHYMYEMVGESYENHPGIFLSMVAYMANLKRTIKPFPVKQEEKQLLFPAITDIKLVEIQSLDQIFEKFILEAIFKREITKTSATRDITNLLVSNLLGSIVSANLQQVSSPKAFFKRNLEWQLRGILGS